VLDQAHIGDIRGSFGTISMRDHAERRTWSRRLITFLAIMGPGIIVMMGDNDAGGVQTYTQAGQQYGTSLLWVMGGLFIVLFILNFLTLLTEFIGINFALSYFGVPKQYSIPVAAVALFTFAATGNFRRWERFMMVFVVGAVIIIPMVILYYPSAGQTAHGFVPGIQGGITGSAILLIVAVVGTTVAPWQLFFQQSNILDKRISPRWPKYERGDTLMGAILCTVFAGAMMCFAAFALNGTRKYGPTATYTDSGWFNEAIKATLGSTADAMAAIMLLVAAVLGAGAVSLSTSYAFGDSFEHRLRLRGRGAADLARHRRDRPGRA
jgi:Mn2+/Fe2+ NRAMP family transporter